MESQQFWWADYLIILSYVKGVTTDEANRERVFIMATFYRLSHDHGVLVPGP